MPIPAIVLCVLFFPSIVAANALLYWAFSATVRDGIWPTESFFGFQRKRPFQLLNVWRRLRERAHQTADKSLSLRSRRILHAIYLGYALGAFAILTFVWFAFTQLP